MSHYRIVVRGVLPGRSVDEVVESLSHMSKKSPERLCMLLDGRRVIVKRTFDVEQAARYRRVLTRMGCACTVEADPAEARDAAAPALTVNLTTASVPEAPASPREFVYATDKRSWPRRLLDLLRPKEWALLTILIAASYYACRVFSERL